MIITDENYRKYRIGTKAQRLFIMRENGLNVPELVCVQSANNLSDFPFDLEGLYSVRSSADCEDGASMSFAGQFSTCLNIRGTELKKYVEKCLSSGNAAEEYIKSMGKDPEEAQITVIIQKMIESEFSGVVFTSNPQGILNETVIVVGNGLGNDVVEDKTDITHYYYNTTDDLYCFERQNNSPLLTEELLKELIAISKKICNIFGQRQDIEFAIKNGEIFVLQARPVTSLGNCPITVLDSSNISESYPEISLPMTVSFVSEVYYQVFRNCVKRATKNDGTAERIDASLHNMTDSVNGRIYYRISNWYDIITLLPFSKKIIPIWQEMLGVHEKEVTHSNENASFMTKLRVTASFFQLLSNNRKNMKKLDTYFNKIYQKYSSAISETDSPDALLELYCGLRSELASHWDITLVNDLYTFIFTGLLKKKLTRKYGSKGQELTNLFIAGNRGIESMNPVKMLAEIKKCFTDSGVLEELRSVNDQKSFERAMDKCKNGAKLISQYIELYGDRCPEELKLETVTYRTKPYLLAENIVNAADCSITNTNKLSKQGILSEFLAKRAANGIKLRESSRMSRGKIFGLVRRIILKIADDLYKNGRIDAPEDVFYLQFNELFEAIQQKEMDLRDLIKKRHEAYIGFEKLPLYSRLVFAGEPFDKQFSDASMGCLLNADTIRGIPCSSGDAEGEVLVVDKLTSDLDSEGKIIVAKMTDPGWVFLLSRSAGIVSERGSLLSHTAIISRELKKPAVVGVKELFSTVRNGDRIHINGSTGIITIIEKKIKMNEAI
ncbi:PEP/pyruvate-binding domain-containing protein [Ruminococcus sp.]|uniref:PEP/pyruvate-binding domain-containing protein n=1 Tax=Ruminococcus sp. TaxID=41978 RepID=UPI0025E06A96|nr:PEP/pyruvate-binding domain-containing protein [Ruminococcus sp.]